MRHYTMQAKLSNGFPMLTHKLITSLYFIVNLVKNNLQIASNANEWKKDKQFLELTMIK